jgi:anthranilate phosphoribosyltransferase
LHRSPTLFLPSPALASGFMTTDAPLRLAIQQVAEGLSLDSESTAAAFSVMMQGSASQIQAAALLMGLRVKGETAEEVAGAALALRRAMIRLNIDRPDHLVDTCGTGGGRVRTLNISTAAAFLVAGAGVPVAKHGNRSYTSRSGSADVLEALGINIGVPPENAGRILQAAGITFLFAPTYHPAMRHLAPVRKELGVSTIMNLLGPLVNPAGVTRQVVGVADQSKAPLVADALACLGTKHALVLHAKVGMDEISPAGRTMVWEVLDGKTQTWELEPGRYGLECDELDDLAGGDPTENASRIEQLLLGNSSTALRCAVVLNAAAALYVSGYGWSFHEAAERATRVLERGTGAEVLNRLRTMAPAKKESVYSTG